MGRDHLDRSPAFVSVRQLLITISQLCLCESLINGYCVVLEHVSFLGSNATYFLRSFVASSVCACLSVRVCLCVCVCVCVSNAESCSGVMSYRVDYRISGCEYFDRCLCVCSSVPLSQQNLVSTTALQLLEMQTCGVEAGVIPLHTISCLQFIGLSMFIFIGRDLGDVALHIFRSIKDSYTMVQLDYAFWGLSKFRRVTLNGGVKYKISYFRPKCRYISETTEGRDIVTQEDKYRVRSDLSNDDIGGDLQ